MLKIEDLSACVWLCDVDDNGSYFESSKSPWMIKSSPNQPSKGLRFSGNLLEYDECSWEVEGRESERKRESVCVCRWDGRYDWNEGWSVGFFKRRKDKKKK